MKDINQYAVRTKPTPVHTHKIHQIHYMHLIAVPNEYKLFKHKCNFYWGRKFVMKIWTKKYVFCYLYWLFMKKRLELDTLDVSQQQMLARTWPGIKKYHLHIGPPTKFHIKHRVLEPGANKKIQVARITTYNKETTSEGLHTQAQNY